MGRERRVEIEGGVYHVISRSIESRVLFHEDEDYEKFIFFLGRACEKFNVDVFSYVLLNNHTHLLLKIKEPNLSKFMHNLNSLYAHYLNDKHFKRGHLFEDRYKSYLITKEKYLIAVARYINLNPVQANLVINPEDYRWSSFRYFISYMRNRFYRESIPDWLKIGEFLRLAGLRGKEFIELVKTDSKAPSFSNVGFYSDRVMDFSSHVLSNKDKEELLEEIRCIINHIKENLIYPDKGQLVERKGRFNRILRNLTVYFLIERGYKIRDIAKVVNLSSSVVSRIGNKVSQELNKSLVYSELFNKISELFY